MPVSGKYSIGIVGFAPNEAAMLEVFFNSGRAKGFELASTSDAQALLIAVGNSGEGRAAQRWMQQNGSRPCIAVVDRGKEDDVAEGCVVLVRPLGMAALQQALADLKEQMVQGPAPARKPNEEHPLGEEQERAEVFAAWQARKERSSQALDAWRRYNSQRRDEELRSCFSVERNELNSLILEAQRQIGQGGARAQQKTEAAPVEADSSSLIADDLKAPKVSAELIQQCCGNLPDVDLDSATERRRIHFSLDGLLLPWVKRAVEAGHASGKPQQVVGVPGALFFLPQEEGFLVNIDADLLLQLARTRFGFDEISLLEREEDAALPQGRHVAADELLWKLALFTARGRLPENLSADEPRLLKTVPDFDRLQEIPHARSVAELWQSQRLSAQNIAAMLGVPQRFVFSFLVAADAIGLYCQ